jgi:hypothetical protein
LNPGPRTVTVPGGKTHLLVMNATDGLPAAFALMGTRAEHKVALRLAGGCKGMDAADKAAMMDYFSTALAGFKGVVWSGGTRQMTPDGQVDPMVTDVPARIAEENPGAVALGTIPRTDMLRLEGESHLVLDDYGTIPNPGMSGILIVQQDAESKMDWDGDVPVYIRIMDNWKTYAGFSHLGLVTWNGGDITRAEIEKSIKQGWTTILVQGTGRETDAYVVALDRKEVEWPDHVLLARKDDPLTLRNTLMGQGFLASA